MHDIVSAAAQTLGEHLGAALWALAIFVSGFALAIPVVRLNVESLLVFPAWLMRLARKYLRPDTNPLLLWTFIFGFNTVAIFIYMISGGLVLLPVVFDFFTGLNLGAVMFMELGEPPEDSAGRPSPRAWVGLLGIFVIVVELSAFWLSIGMGMKLGHAMERQFAWATFVQMAGPRLLAYFVLAVPALAVAAAAETITIKAMSKP